MKKIVHLTSVHSRFDTRIYIKECKSLARIGNNLSLVVADGNGNEKSEGISIYDVGSPKSRLDRIFFTTSRVLRKAISLNGDLYHFHDPELLFVGLMLRVLGKKVIMDAHEDLPKQFLHKPYLNYSARRVISKFLTLLEFIFCRFFSGVITATPHIKKKFLKINSNTIDINNYPVLGEFNPIEDYREKELSVCYVGGITEIRGIIELVKAMDGINGLKLILVGEFSSKDLFKSTCNLPSWVNVEFKGQLDRVGVANVLKKSLAGIVTFLPVPNHIDSQPNKMFEYMSAGLPVIASHFPLWKEIIEGNKCGVCVDPNSPKSIREGINYVVTNTEKAKEMGNNGRKAILTKYNWEQEENKLFCFYNKLLSL